MVYRYVRRHQGEIRDAEGNKCLLCITLDTEGGRPRELTFQVDPLDEKKVRVSLFQEWTLIDGLICFLQDMKEADVRKIVKKEKSSE